MSATTAGAIIFAMLIWLLFALWNWRCEKARADALRIRLGEVEARYILVVGYLRQWQAQQAQHKQGRKEHLQ